MLGMMFGVGAVIAMLAIGAGAERQALAAHRQARRAQRRGARQGLQARGAGRGAQEVARPVAARRRRHPRGGAGRRARRPAPAARRVQGAERGRKDARRRSSASRTCRRSSSHMRLDEGRFLDARDDETHAQSCVIGERRAARSVRWPRPRSARDLKINDVWCEVVGVLAPRGLGGSDPAGRLGRVRRRARSTCPSRRRRASSSTIRSSRRSTRSWCVWRRASRRGRPSRSSPGCSIGSHGGVVDYETVVPEALLEQSRADPAPVQRRDGRHRGHLAARRRHRDHEHHARVRARADARDRRSPRGRRAPQRHPLPVSRQRLHAVAARRRGGRARRRRASRASCRATRAGRRPSRWRRSRCPPASRPPWASSPGSTRPCGRRTSTRSTRFATSSELSSLLFEVDAALIEQNAHRRVDGGRGLVVAR